MFNVGDLVEKIGYDEYSPNNYLPNAKYLVVDLKKTYSRLLGINIIRYRVMCLDTEEHYTVSLDDSRLWRKV